MSKNSKDSKFSNQLGRVGEVSAPTQKAIVAGHEDLSPVVVAKENKKQSPRIYVGPTIIGRGITENTIFKGYELPQNVQALLNEHAFIRSLIVPVSRLNEVQARLNDTTSLEFKNFQQATKIN